MALALLMAFFSTSASAEDGYELWLRYRPVEAPLVVRYRRSAREIIVDRGSFVAAGELRRGIEGLLHIHPRIRMQATGAGAIVLGTPQSSSLVARMHIDLSQSGSEGFVIRTITLAGRRASLELPGRWEWVCSAEFCRHYGRRGCP